MHPCHTFVLASVNSFGLHGKPIMQHIHALSDIALARFLAATCGSSLLSAHWELSGALALLYRVRVVYATLAREGCTGQVLPEADTTFLGCVFCCNCGSCLVTFLPRMSGCILVAFGSVG
jgi:hypothetical protein